ncbi:hypothetical protein BJ165DRAFT_1531785 [Panaeolus papilionaceus]|nr:hypothetical protein BJ165DRAFT_1531785 [Panaeolus papilionaceus]
MHSDSDIEAKVKTDPVTPTINSQVRSGEAPNLKPATPTKKSHQPVRSQQPEQDLSPKILWNAEDKLEELHVCQQAASSFSFDGIPLTPEQIEEIEDAHDEDARCLQAGEFTFFEHVVQGRIEDEHWQAHRLMPAKNKDVRHPLHPSWRKTFIGPVVQQGLEGSENNNRLGEVVGGGGADDEIGPGDGTGRPAGDDWMSEIDPNKHGDSDEPCQDPTTPQCPKLRTVYSMSAPHVKCEALPLTLAEQSLID